MPSDSSSVGRRYSFGSYTLDPVRRLLWRDGALVALTPKTVAVLTVLVERHGTIVEKDDLLRFVWPKAVVEENNLPRHISILRKALQQRRGQHDYISTIPGRGYMFVAAVTECEEVPAPGSPGATPAEQPGTAEGSALHAAATAITLTTGLTLAASLMLIAAAGAAWYVAGTSGRTCSVRSCAS